MEEACAKTRTGIVGGRECGMHLILSKGMRVCGEGELFRGQSSWSVIKNWS
jgi:hypothetical protein